MYLYQRATVGFFSINITAIAVLYFIFPFMGIDIHPFYSGLFISLTAVCVISGGCFIYFITKKYWKKIKEERSITEQLIYRYQSISNAANDAIWDYDMVTGIVYYSSQIEKLFGYTADEMTSNRLWWEQNIHSDDKEGVLNKVNKTLASSKNIWQDEYRFRCKNGSYKNVYDRSFIVRNEDCIPVRLIGSMVDITVFRHKDQAAAENILQKQRRVSLAIVKETEEEKRKWRYQLSEEIGQVLVASKLQLYSGGKKDKQQKKSIEYIEEAISKVKKLSDEIRPALLDHFGLVDAVTAKLEGFKKVLPVLIKFDHEGFNQSRINETVALLLYKIIKEQTEDIVANTDASLISILLDNTAAKKTVLSITDNRMSKLTKNAGKILSVEEIKNRVYLLNGNLKIMDDKLHEYTLLAEV
jgi:two-component system, NarL family, sensor histidine kinase UhpB